MSEAHKFKRIAVSADKIKAGDQVFGGIASKDAQPSIEHSGLVFVPVLMEFDPHSEREVQPLYIRKTRAVTVHRKVPHGDLFVVKGTDGQWNMLDSGTGLLYPFCDKEAAEEAVGFVLAGTLDIECYSPGSKVVDR